MKFVSNLFLAVVLSTTSYSQLDTSLVRFEDFPAKEVYTSKPAPVDFSHNPRAAVYRTRIRAGAESGPNFAGHFTLVGIGCGSSCLSLAVVDAKSGKVHISKTLNALSWGPGEEYGLSWPFGLKFQLKSRLLIAYGHRNDEEAYGLFYFVWRDTDFTIMKFVPLK